MDTYLGVGYPLVEVRETEKEITQSKTESMLMTNRIYEAHKKLQDMIFMQRTAT
jgi:hypothetical protein